ncbi:MAG: hypothetical protein GY950_02530 [bacterium]|nr:hypothetical protein [bacterium]
MKKLFFIIIFVCAVFGLAVDAASSSFRKTYGGSNIDRGITVHQASDGGYIITGFTKSFGAGKEDVYLVKTDAAGNTQWTKTFGGKDTDNGWAVLQTTDGGYIITGFTKSFGAGGYDVYLVKTGSTGETQWTKTFGGKGDDRSWDLGLTTDGGYIIVGETDSTGKGARDALLIKTGKKGVKQWKRSYGGPKDDRLFSVQQTPDGGYISAGITYSFGEGDRDAYVIKTDPGGNPQWTKTYGGKQSDVGHCVRLSADGGYIVTGYTSSFSKALNDVYLLKLDKAGNTQWVKTFGGKDDYHTLYGQQTTGGGYILTGGIISADRRAAAACLIKTDAVGNLQWEKRFEEKIFKAPNVVRGYNGRQTVDGGFVFAGDIYGYGTDKGFVYLVKVDGNGN